ncbi:hypothetical protein JOD01_001032 [Brevibacillus fulvus]|uniref:Uncharacterized protein n=1 Tax=Brevibacillus fulvus TaxID=1125967 RepID=A0A938XWJ9_9BACL|nr:hypothetical protein [Brevibacillus fulvus]
MKARTRQTAAIITIAVLSILAMVGLIYMF